jgi:hypothetical protein
VARENRMTKVEMRAMSNASLQDQIGLALKSLLDRSALNRSPLARLSYVERAARDQYGGRLMPRGLALRAILESCIDEVVNDLSGEPALKNQCEYLRMIKSGVTCKEIGRALGRSREHVSRKYRKEAVALVSEEFLQGIRGEERTARDSAPLSQGVVELASRRLRLGKMRPHAY